MDLTILRNIGLTDGEIKVYLALLELGSSTTGPIIEKSGIAKSIVYQILERLAKKGLTSHKIKEKTKHFQAAEPDKILQYITERENKLKENKKKVEKLLPELLLKQNKQPNSDTIMYFGDKGILTAHQELYNNINKDDEVYYIGIKQEWFNNNNNNNLLENICLERNNKFNKISKKILINKSLTEENKTNFNNNYNSINIKFLPINLTSDIIFTISSKEVIISINKLTYIAIKIKDKNIVESFKLYFQDFWLYGEDN
jgi:sugar-specific transcriptional regulator TrmB